MKISQEKDICPTL